MKEENTNFVEETAALGCAESFLEEFEFIKEKTLKNNKIEVTKINCRLARFYALIYPYSVSVGETDSHLVAKLGEIRDSLRDSFALSIFGRYKTAFFLMRKALELFSIAVYLDSQGKINDKTRSWAFGCERPPVKVTKAISKIDNEKNDLGAFYEFLCSFVHNVGTEEYKFVFDYDKQAFKIYAEKMLFLLDFMSKWFIDKKQPKITAKI